MTSPSADPASYRDPDSRVFVKDGRIFRAFTRRGAEEYAAFAGTDLQERFAARGQLIESRKIDPGEADGFAEAVPDCALVLEHPRVPFLSWCYEWPFEMLRDAGLLQLDLALESLERGYLLKDATPYNVQFLGTRPVHIDLGSFEPWPEGTPWKAYTQFCRLFLNPLLLSSMTGVDFHPWLRGRLEGIEPRELSNLLPWYRKMRWSVFVNVALQARLNRRAQASEPPAAGRSMKVTKFQLRGILESLRATVRRLKPRRPGSEWTGYEEEAGEAAGGETRKAKDAFVEKALAEASPPVVWDLGSNTGRYAAMAARGAEQVVAMDRDPQVVGLLYERMVREGHKNVLCLVMDLLDPSPSQGWSQRERGGLSDRGRADFCLCLALIHHLAISGNLPMERFFDWLDGITDGGVIEFVPKQDPRVQQLLRWREDIFRDYDRERFEKLLKRRFRIRDQCVLSGSERVLYAFSR